MSLPRQQNYQLLGTLYWHGWQQRKLVEHILFYMWRPTSRAHFRTGSEVSSDSLSGEPATASLLHPVLYGTSKSDLGTASATSLWDCPDHQAWIYVHKQNDCTGPCHVTISKNIVLLTYRFSASTLSMKFFKVLCWGKNRWLVRWTLW